ncbi:peptidase M75 [Bacteroidia bacterium]|nr:peptidase M75 [Bacteroidia bacterium]
MKTSNNYLVAIALLGAGLFAACDNNENEGNDNPDVNNAQIEALATNAKWNNYLVAATEELYNDCVRLWAAWAGADALSADELAIVGSNFWTSGELNAPNGYAALVKNPGNAKYPSGINAVEATIIQGTIDIAGEVGGQKIGGPYNYALAGKYAQGVLEVESWYSWNSITDYSDNIVSVRNSYLGVRGGATASANSLSAFVKARNPALDTAIIAAINAAYNGIRAMDAPFRNNLTGAKVVAAMTACADLEDVYRKELLPLVREAGAAFDFTPILTTYADEIVVASYKDMKDKARALRDAAQVYAANPSNARLSAACDAWKAARIPWEQSEAFLYGPADLLGLDPSLDSWPLDQDDILTILRNEQLTTVQQIQGAIAGEGVRGFHTIELLLFKDGQDRTIQ